MVNKSDGSWGIECTPDAFDAMKSNKKFLGLLTLARFLNALRFCQQPAIDTLKVDSPIDRRRMINSFLFASSVLYEGFLLVERLKKIFQKFDSFKNGFGILLKDKSVIDLRKSVLHRMRNKFVFHFDNNIAIDALRNLELPKYRFASCLGKAPGNMYFELADLAVVIYLTQPGSKIIYGVETQQFTRLAQEVTALMNRFSDAAMKLMDEVLPSLGWETK